MTGVLTALGNPWESRVATLLEGSRVVQIVRRCADLADLARYGARAFLVGESLMRQADLAAATRALLARPLSAAGGL